MAKQIIQGLDAIPAIWQPGQAPIQVISLGAGVQSSTMALMAARGELSPMPDAAIFADTQGEPLAIYEWLDWLEGELPFPVYRISAGDLRADILKGLNSTGERFVPVPFFTKSGALNRLGRTRRQCTKEYKVRPIIAAVRALLGVPYRKHGPKETAVVQWIGISRDEAGRMKPARHRYIEHRWPLIDQGLNRFDCLAWMARNGYPMPQKSSCVFCPYHSNGHWRDMKMANGPDWAAAVALDAALRELEDDGHSRFEQELYLHPSGEPLGEVDFRNLEDLGQLDLFGNECEGLCGV